MSFIAHRFNWCRIGDLVLVLLLSLPMQPSLAEDGPSVSLRFQITGLFCPEREQDLRLLFQQKFPLIRIAQVDFPNAEVTFEFNPEKVYTGASPEQLRERLDHDVRNACRHTFGIKALRTIPKEKLTHAEISIVGLDCKACSLAVYEMIARIEGVEIATASFKDGKANAWFDPLKTDRNKIESELKNRGVVIISASELPKE